MPTVYTIHLRNTQANKQPFWCFLSEPESGINAKVFANSSANLTVPTYTGSQDNYFSIPLQYMVQAGASNNAVGLNTRIVSNVKEDTDLGLGWLATYFPLNEGPTLDQEGTCPTDELDITTNNFDKSKEPLNKWYGNLTYGVKSQNGFMGVTWSPDPGKLYRIKPKVQFYVSVGDFSSNTLADMTAISSAAASITENSFDGNYECTVVLNTDGTWKVFKGNLNQSVSALEKLMESHLHMSSAHAAMVDLLKNTNTAVASKADPDDEWAVSSGVTIDSGALDNDQAMAGGGFITGTISIRSAIGLGFVYMIASGIKVSVTNRSPDGLKWKFSYNGSASSQALKEAFEAGKEIEFDK